LLRQTEAHTAVLIDGKGHQYHDGHEGTNASWAFARVIDFRTGEGWMTVTSDATDAYALVNERVKRVHRTLVFLKPDVVVFFDRVAVDGAPAVVQARFQANNEDLGANVSVADGVAGAGESAGEFTITRPSATLRGRVAANGAVTARAGRLALEEKDGIYPFAEVASAAANEHEIVTVCTARPAGEEHGTLTVERAASGDGWQVSGTHGGRVVKVTLRAQGNAAPVVTV
jgi:hypothetical protein